MIESQTAFPWPYKVNLWVAMNSWFCIQVCKSKVYSLIYGKKWSSGDGDTLVFFLLKNPKKPTKTPKQRTNQNFSTAVGQKSLKPRYKCTLKPQNTEENNPVFFKFPNFCTKPPLQSQLMLFSLGFLSDIPLGRSSASCKLQMLLSALRVPRKHREMIEHQILSVENKWNL